MGLYRDNGKENGNYYISIEIASRGQVRDDTRSECACSVQTTVSNQRWFLFSFEDEPLLK